MKNALFAITALAAMSTSAFAGPLGYWGSVEYATEAQTFSTVMGVQYSIESFTLAPSVTLDDTSGNFELTEVELMGVYDFNGNLSAYTTVGFDGDFNYTETVIGVAFAF